MSEEKINAAIVAPVGDKDTLSKVWCPECDRRFGPICYAIARGDLYRRSDEATFPMVAKLLRLELAGNDMVPDTEEYMRFREQERQYHAALAQVFSDLETDPITPYEDVVSLIPRIPDDLWYALTTEGFTRAPDGTYRRARGHRWKGGPPAGRRPLPPPLRKRGGDNHEMLGSVVTLPARIRCPKCDEPLWVLPSR